MDIQAPYHFMGNRWGNSGNSDGEIVETVSDFIWGGAPKSLQMVVATIKLKMLTPWKESYDQPR